MRVLLEHLRKRTVPHELIDFFNNNNVPFYEECMIVQIHDHKSSSATLTSNRVTAVNEKTVPFSVHNYHASVTPSPYMPYPEENAGRTKSLPEPTRADDSKTSAEKDKENMPAPAVPSDSQKKSSQKRTNVSTIVLHPTALSAHIEVASKAVTPRVNPADARTESKQDSVLSSSNLQPSTPAVPSTPGINMGPPAKRLKKAKMEFDSSNIHLAEALIAKKRYAPLVLDPARSAKESANLLSALEHPMHCEKPPQPKTRKRTIAEMAADEALAAEQEQFMLIMDERLSASKGGVQGGGKAADNDGQAGGAPFEPRFERFKTLENIRLQHEENRRIERSRQVEAERQNAEKQKREQLRAAAEEERRMQQERQRSQQAHQQAQHQLQQAREQEQRRALLARQQGMQAMPTQVQGQHGHPQPGGMQNGMVSNGIQGQPQRFHQQQVTQGPMSSPIIRNGTPHSNPSPTVGNIGNVPMQHSTSSMGGSPPPPGSVVNQNPSQIPTSHAMSTQRSQQSHPGDTPRMPSATPNIQSTPLARQVSATPRMSAASPPQPQMAQTPTMGMGQQVMMNTPMHMTPQQQQHYQQQVMARRLQHAQAMGGMINGQQMSPQQFQQHQMRAMQANGVPPNQQIAQNYAAQLAAMQRPGGPQMNPNVAANNPVMNMQQIQQMQMQQQQMQHQVQNQQMPQMSQQQQQQMMQQRYHMRVQKTAQGFLQQHLPQINVQYHGNIPPEVLDNLKRQCQEKATTQVQSEMQRQRQVAQAQAHQQQQLQQQMMMQQGGMPQNMNTMGRQI